MHILLPEWKIHGTNDHHEPDDREVRWHHDTEKDHAGASGEGIDVEDDSRVAALEEELTVCRKIGQGLGFAQGRKIEGEP